MDEIFDVLSLAVENSPATDPGEANPEETPAAARLRPAGAPSGRVSTRRLRKPLMVLAILALAAFPAYTLSTTLTHRPASVRAAQAVEAGLGAHRAGRIQQAAVHYREAVQLDPLNKFAHYNLGLIAQTSGDAATAEGEYRLTLSIDPKFTIAMYNLAIIRAAAGSLDEAANLYRQVITLKPKDGPAHLNLGFVLMRLGMQSKARAEFAEAVRLDPKLAGRVPKDAG